MSFLKKKIFNKITLVQNLSTIYGIGENSANNICKHFGCNPGLSFKNLREDQLYKLLNFIEKQYILIENNLKLFKKNNFNYLVKVKNYRSLRHKYSLPARGQRTHTRSEEHTSELQSRPHLVCRL